MSGVGVLLNWPQPIKREPIKPEAAMVKAHATAGHSGTLRQIWWIAALTLLFVPSLAGQFSSVVKWGAGDFAAAALLLALTGGALELIAHYVASARLRNVAASTVIVVMLSIWVGIVVGKVSC